jgi:hypothetical protein
MHPDPDLSIYSFGLSEHEAFVFNGAVADLFGLSTDHEAFCFNEAVADLEEDQAPREPVAPGAAGNVIPFRPRHAEATPSTRREDGP